MDSYFVGVGLEVVGVELFVVIDVGRLRCILVVEVGVGVMQLLLFGWEAFVSEKLICNGGAFEVVEVQVC